MRWKKVVIGAVMGGLLGFAGQFFVDFFSWVSDTNSPTLYQFFFSDTIQREGVESSLEVAFGQNEAVKRQAWALMFEEYCLSWVLERGELAGRAAIIVALLNASATTALERKTKANATGVKASTNQRSGEANSIIEPKMNLLKSSHKANQLKSTSSIKTAPIIELAETAI